MSAVAIASKIAKKTKTTGAKKTGKRRPSSKCASLVRQRESIDRKRETLDQRIEAIKQANADGMRKEQEKIEARHQAQHQKIDDEKAKQLAKLATKYGQACVPKVRKPRSDKGQPKAPTTTGETQATARPRAKGAKKAGKKAKPAPAADGPPAIINLTPHTLTITDGPYAGSYASKGIARVDSLPLGQVVGLPAPRKGQLYVVSLIVAERLPTRQDLRVPGEQVRDGQGRVVASRGLALPRDVSPALASNDAATPRASKRAARRNATPSRTEEPGPVPQPRPVPPQARPETVAARAANTDARPRGQAAAPVVVESVPTLPFGSMRATADSKAVKEVFSALKRYRPKLPKGKPGSRYATKVAFLDVVTVWASNIGGQGRLGFRAFTDEGELVLTVPADVRQIGAVRLDMSSFRQALPAGDSVTINAADDVATIEAGGSGLTLVSTSLEGEESRGFLPVYDSQASAPKVARMSLEAVLYAVSTDEARVNINGLFVGQDGGQTLLAATDSHRLITHTDRSFSIPADRFVLGRQEAEIAASLLVQSSSFLAARGRDGSVILAGAGKALRWTLSAYERKVEFPPYRQVIPSTFTHVCDVPAEALRTVLKPLVVGKKPKENHGRFVFHDGMLEVSRTSLDNPASGRLPLRCAPAEDLIFGGNLLYFLEAVSNGPIADSSDVRVFYQDGDENIKARAKGKALDGTLNPLRLVATGATWTTVAVIMPIRL